MTPNEITTLLASQLDKTFDDPFKLMMIKRVDAWRSRLIKNSLDKEPKDRRFFRQTIYLSMTKVPEINCDLGFAVCDVAQSLKLPKVLRANSIMFDYVGAINGANPFQETYPGMIGYLNQGKYSSKLIQYSNINDTIVVYNKPTLPMIRVDAIWDNPFDVANLICGALDDVTCNFWNLEYPCTNDILQQIIEFIPQTMKLTPDEISVPVSPETDILK